MRILTFIILVTASLNVYSSEADHSGLLPETQVKELIKKAYRGYSEQYSVFAKLFNLCQKKPHDIECKEPYENAKKEYKASKALYDTLEVQSDIQFRYLPAPPMSLKPLDDNLRKLGYLKTEQDVEPNFQTRLGALNKWAVNNGLPETNRIYLLHVQLVEAEVKFN
ncbi:hypothetical protein [Thalassotalea atypica]|uniref:hypothetical protein n=1 Tax=Thalassotalea atypica TaxID=2054316 RepID=UPI0025729AA0|nr:hypothetical protein [Thalassotalea atypica]